MFLLAAYLVARPPVADLAAQVARANISSFSGTAVWWTGWFGGVTLPTYSATAPWLMAHLGAPLIGTLAALIALLAARTLLRTAPRPRLGTAVFGLFDVADVAVGRITFALGLALGLLTLCAFSHPRLPRWCALASSTACAVLSCLTSPLAGLFTGLACLAVVISDSRRRVAAGLAVVALLGCSGGLALLFPGVGTMPTTLADMLPALGVTAAVGVLSRPRVLRVGASLAAAAIVLFTVTPGPVGENITRLAWVLGTPLAVAYGSSPLRGVLGSPRWKAAVLGLTAVVTGLAPALDVAHQLGAASDESARMAFYTPLVEQLAAQRAADPQSLGQRVEVVDPRTHWSSVYVAGAVPLARGWNRQADAALNGLFYQPGALTAASYVRWLHSLAVGWVALPHTELDHAAVGEGKLVASGVPGLRKVWGDEDWTLYRVTVPSPLASGAVVVDVGPTEVTIDVPVATAVVLRIRWTPLLAVEDSGSGSPLAVCPVATPEGMTELSLPAGRWRIGPNLLRDTVRQLWDGCASES